MGKVKQAIQEVEQEVMEIVMSRTSLERGHETITFPEVQTILSNNPYCEPMLSKRNLYPKLGGSNFQIASKEKSQSFFKSIMWILFYADGKNSVDFITKKSKIPKKELLILIQKLKKVNLIKENV